MENVNNSESGKRSKKPIVRIILILIIAMAGYWAISKYIYSRNHEETDDAQLDTDISPVSARVSGFVEEIRFKENQYVNSGDTLVLIDKRELMNKVSQAEAAVVASEAAESVARANVNTASANLRTAQSAIDAARVRVWKADKELSRITNLQKEDAGTVQQLDAAKAEKDAADAQLVTNNMQRESNAASLASAQEQVKVAASNVVSRKVELDLARLQLSFATIIAPVSGIAAKKNIQPGQLVSAGTPFFAIVAEKEPYVMANFKETQVGAIRVGQPVDVHVDAFPEKTFKGKVNSFSPATGAKFSLLPPDNATGNYVKVVQRLPVKIELEPDSLNQRLKPGMSVRVSVEVL